MVCKQAPRTFISGIHGCQKKGTKLYPKKGGPEQTAESNKRQDHQSKFEISVGGVKLRKCGLQNGHEQCVANRKVNFKSSEVQTRKR